MRVACFNPRGRLSWAANANAGERQAFVCMFGLVYAPTRHLFQKVAILSITCNVPGAVATLWERRSSTVGARGGSGRQFWFKFEWHCIQHDASQRASLDCFLVRLIVHLTRRRRDRLFLSFLGCVDPPLSVCVCVKGPCSRGISAICSTQAPATPKICDKRSQPLEKRTPDRLIPFLRLVLCVLGRGGLNAADV